MPYQEPPTGIIRTLPSLYASRHNPGCVNLLHSIRECRRSETAGFLIALAQQPKHELLHLYLLIGGRIRWRFTLAGYQGGDTARCWDESIMRPKVWAICTGPVERPPQPLLRRGFQGFRYVFEPLW